MINKFVNTGNKIAGDKVQEEAHIEAKKQIEQDKIDRKPLQEKPVEITLKEGKNILIGVTCKLDLEIDEKKSPTIFLFDENGKVGEINKNSLITACQKLQKDEEKETGIKWTKPMPQHVLELHVPFEQRLYCVGDISGLDFYFKN